MTIRILIALTVFFSSCTAVRVVKPLEKGDTSIGLDIGGPIVSLAGAPLLVPMSSLNVAYGLKDNTTIFGGIHTTSMIFGVVQTDIGFLHQFNAQSNYLPSFTLGVSNHFTLDIWENNFKSLPQLDLNAYWHYKQKDNFVYASLQTLWDLSTTKAHGVTNTDRIIPTFTIGHRFVREKMSYSIEYKQLAFSASNQQITVNFVSPFTTGASGLFFSISRTF